MRSPRSFAVLALLVVLCVPGVRAGSQKTTQTGLVKTDHFDVRYRPGSRAAASVERNAAMIERNFADICAKLEFTPKGRFELYIYDDEAELFQITGLQVGGYASARELHIPHDNDQTRYHELAHVLTARLPQTGSEKRNMFFPDGIANALLEYVHGIPVHAVAKFHRNRKELPPLAKLTTGDFYAWQGANPRINGYDIGGSFFRFLLDTYGVENTKRYYTGTTAKKAFGVDLAKVERAWHKALEGYVLRPEVETLLRQKAGEPVEFRKLGLPPEILGKPSEWRSLTREKLLPRTDAPWKREGDTIVGSAAAGGWHVCDLGTRKYGDCVVRGNVVYRGELAGVQIQLGDGAAAMIVGPGTFAHRHDKGAYSPARTIEPDGQYDLMLVRRGGAAEVWVDGVKLVTGPVDADARPVGIGFHCRTSPATVRFTDLRVRMLN